MGECKTIDSIRNTLLSRQSDALKRSICEIVDHMAPRTSCLGHRSKYNMISLSIKVCILTGLHTQQHLFIPISVYIPLD